MITVKLKAALFHLTICCVLTIAVLGLVYGGWYSGGLAPIEGVGTILLLILGVDVVLGPILTFLVYKPKKKSLVFDLSVIAFMQTAFLAYGVYTVERARPLFVVFEENRFETVSYADLPIESRNQLKEMGNPKTASSFFKPTYVVALPPTDPTIAKKILDEALAGGTELSQMPKYYNSPEVAASTLLAKAKAAEALKNIKGNSGSDIELFVKSLGMDLSNLKTIPLKGKSRDAVVFIDSQSARVVSIGLFRPWP
jgi:hypothetical protein